MKSFAKKSLIAVGAIAAFGGGVLAEKNFRFTQATDLYAKNPNTSACVRLVAAANQLSSKIQKGLGTIQATIQSDGGTRYNLFEDSGCSTAVFFTGS